MQTVRNRQERPATGAAAVLTVLAALRLGGLGRLLLRRGWNRLLLLRRGRLYVHLGVADLDLGAGRYPAVGGGQVDVQRGDEATESLRATGAGRAVEALLEGRQVPPVGERDAAVGRGTRRLSEYREADDARG